MKTRLYIPPGTVLDYDNENHRRQMEDEAFASIEDHPKPTMKPPERSIFWAFWRMFGMFLYDPIRTIGRRFLWCRSDDHAGAKWINDWIRRGATRGPNAFWLRALLSWLFEDHYSTCPTCGFTDFHDEFTILDEGSLLLNKFKILDEQTINMFELVDGGGEGEDAYGWQWCYRCGQVSWECA